jgi:hypothetical protein
LFTSNTPPSQFLNTVSFTCRAPVSAGQLTVPPVVLLALPPGTDPAANGSLSVGNYANGQQFPAAGLDIGIVAASVNVTSLVTCK